jgi:ABC-2 type transport system permease protein
MRPILVLIRKEFQQVLRDRLMLPIIFMMPLVQTFLMGYAVTTDVKHQRLVILDQDRSTSTRDIVTSLRHCGYFDLEGYAASRNQLGDFIYNGKADLGVIFPSDFEADLEMGRSPMVQIIVDGQNSSTSSISLGYVVGILQDFSQNIVFERRTVDARQAASIHPLEGRTRIFYNPTLESVYYMIPGIATVLLTVITMMLTAMGLVREKEIGTLEQLLVTPIRSYQLLIGKLVPFAILGFFALSIILLFGTVWFGLPFEGNVGVVALATILFILSTLGLGLFISTVASTQQQAMFIAWFFMVFGLLMSGFFYAIENMPVWAQRLTLINPLRYYLAVLREVFLKGAGIPHLQFEFVALAMMGLSILTLTVARFRTKLK